MFDESFKNPNLMPKQHDDKNINIGILGCGAIGSRIAVDMATNKEPHMTVTGVYDINPERSLSLCRQLKNPSLQRNSFDQLIDQSDLIVESVAAADTVNILERIIRAGKHVLVMSVGKLLQGEHLFALAQQQGCQIIVPSGAIAGIDALKAVHHATIHEIILTTRKPPQGLAGAPFIIANTINLSEIKEETVIFEGNVDEAIKAFPQNINVAATVALASRQKEKLRVRIITSPTFQHNIHELQISGDFGRMTTRTENCPCPDNPKTSYLAVLSGIESLRSFCHMEKIGT